MLATEVRTSRPAQRDLALDLALGIFGKGFQAGTRFQAQGVIWVRRRYANGRLRGAETLDGRFRIVEQNQAKASSWADLARQGHLVAWVFDNTLTGSQYTARVVDVWLEWL